MLVLMLAYVLFAATICAGYYEVNYVIPHSLDVGQEVVTDSEVTPAASTSVSSELSADTSAGVTSTSSVYHSSDVSVTLKHVSYDSGVFDNSASGANAHYGSKISYTLADVHVKDASNIRTAFAQDTYGVGFSELLSSMSARMGSVVGVSGDSYSNNRHAKNGTIVRNGVIYRARSSTEETCVLYRDGTMRVFPPGSIDESQLVADGAWQSWVFGPSLLDEGGDSKTKFTTWDYITESHPRTAIGYYGPGHYCLLVVDGREPGRSRGMFLSEMSKLFSDLGCRIAYNLDGGHCSSMTKGTTVVSNPYKPSKEISDGLFICETGGTS